MELRCCSCGKKLECKDAWLYSWEDKKFYRYGEKDKVALNDLTFCKDCKRSRRSTTKKV